MGGQAEARKKLNSLFQALHEKYRPISQQVENYDKVLDAAIKDFKNVLQLDAGDICRDKGNAQTDGGDKLAKLKETFAAARDILGEKCDAMLAELENAHKTATFRNMLPDHMMVYVYGKVKSGKSSLGNFIARGNHNPPPVSPGECPDLEYDVHEVSKSSGDEAEKLAMQKRATRVEKKFQVDFFEATSSIQYFKQPGLAWIDSPGIHSVTGENGKLARDYLNSSDLVIYTMSGRSTARETDRKELVEIIKSEKPLLIVVTRCDNETYDEGEDGELRKVRVMFPLSEREEVKAFCVQALCDELREVPGLQGNVIKDRLASNIVAISCPYAEEHPDGHEWEDSGLAQLYDRLCALASEQGGEIKFNTLRKNILDHARRTRELLEPLDSEMGKLRAELEKTSQKLDLEVKRIKQDSSLAIDGEITKASREFYGNDRLFTEKVRELVENQLSEAAGRLGVAFAKSAVSLAQKTKLDTELSGLPAFKDITRTVTYHSGKKGLWGSLFGGAILGIATLATGGGALVAATAVAAGGAAGKYIGGKFDEDKEGTHVVGNNSQDVARAARKIAAEILDKNIDVLHDDLAAASFSPLGKWLADVEEKSAAIRAILENQEQTQKSGI